MKWLVAFKWMITYYYQYCYFTNDREKIYLIKKVLINSKFNTITSVDYLHNILLIISNSNFSKGRFKF